MKKNKCTSAKETPTLKKMKPCGMNDATPAPATGTITSTQGAKKTASAKVSLAMRSRLKVSQKILTWLPHSLRFIKLPNNQPALYKALSQGLKPYHENTCYINMIASSLLGRYSTGKHLAYLQKNALFVF